jgi:nucleoside-diphosphate-sugar epimerase
VKVLFIGGTGIISTACTALAAERGIELTLLNRGKAHMSLPAGVKTITADVRNEAEAAAALAGKTFDAVADFIAFTPDDIERNIRLFTGKTDQFIFISSASAYHKPVTHYRITESTPLANPYWQYSRNKIACEEKLLAEYRSDRFPAVIVRPSYTYGDTLIPLNLNSHSRPWSVIDRMKRGKKIIIPGDGTSLWTNTHNTDFAKGFVGLLGNLQTIGHAFHITSDESMTWDQFHQVVGQIVGAPPKFCHVPTDTLIAHNPDLEGGLLGDKSWSVVFDNSKIKSFVPDFVCTTPFRIGVARTIAKFAADPAKQAIDEEWNKWCDDVIAAQERALPLKRKSEE